MDNRRLPVWSEINYNDFVGNVSISNLRLETTIANITAFAFATLIGFYSFLGGLTTSAAILLKDEIIAYDNKTQYLSMKGKQYYHEDGHRIPNGIYVTKVVGTWYTKRDYQGDDVSFPVYNCKEYY